jgi:hypothetical protein
MSRQIAIPKSSREKFQLNVFFLNYNNTLPCIVGPPFYCGIILFGNASGQTMSGQIAMLLLIWVSIYKQVDEEK